MEHEIPEGGPVGVTTSDAAALADRHADDVAALHRVSSLAPGDPDERLEQLIGAGCDVLGSGRGFVLLRQGSDLTVRVVAGSEVLGPVAGETIADWRLDDVLERQATVASLGGPGAPEAGTPLGGGSMVACPLWVTGRVAGVVAFADSDSREPFTSWQLAIVDLVADGVSRILEHEADIRAMVRLESQAQSAIDLIPDPIVRLRDDGQELAEDGKSVLGPFDPTAGARPSGTPADPKTLEEVQQAVTSALASGRLQRAVFAAGPGEEAQRVEARFVPGDGQIVLCIVRDITERHRAELALAEQVAFEALVASISTRLIGCPAHLLDDAIETGLGEIASFFGADTAYIDELSPDGATLRISHLWTRRSVLGRRARGQRVDLTGFEWLTARFERAGHVFVRGPGTIPPEATTSSVAEPDDRGALWVRLGYGGELVGVLGMTWRTHEPPASDEVLGLVRFAADAFLGALRRRSVALLADGQAEVFELIARGAPVATALLAAGSLLERNTLGATVVVVTLDDDGQLELVTGVTDDSWSSWFAAIEPGLANPFGQAVITGEPVMVANAQGDPRFAVPVLPDPHFRSATILPVRSQRSGRVVAIVGLLGDEQGAPIARPAVRDSVLSLVAVAVERSIDEERLAHQATHDPLTGCGNRAALLDRLELALARAKRSGRAVAVLFCDLDSFKAVNDRYGHDRGDGLLIEVAGRIAKAVRPSDTLCRTGGDEFVIVCEDLADPEHAHVIADRIRASVEARPIDVQETRLSMTISVGVAIADLTIDDPDRLLRAADLAMYARKQDRSGTGESSPETDASPGPVGQREADPFTVELADAIERDQLHLLHQPIVGRDGSVAGIEALVRWNHPVHGPVGAERILSAADDGGFAGALGSWVRRRAFADRAQWSDGNPRHASVHIHVNLREGELLDPALADAVRRDLDHAGADASDLVLEVRERHTSDPTIQATIAELSRRGIAVLVEDAGQGGVSLADLAGLEVAGLKLGQGLVDRIREDDPLGVEVARSLVMLAHGLGWRSQAVAVETEHQRAVLFGFGVDAVQGRVETMGLVTPELHTWLEHRVAR